MLKVSGYNDSYAERALALLDKDVCYLASMNWGYNMDREEVAQELRMHLWNKLHMYHPTKASLRTWAQQVMRRRLMDMAKISKRHSVPFELIISFEEFTVVDCGYDGNKEPSSDRSPSFSMEEGIHQVA